MQLEDRLKKAQSAGLTYRVVSSAAALAAGGAFLVMEWFATLVLVAGAKEQQAKRAAIAKLRNDIGMQLERNAEQQQFHFNEQRRLQFDEQILLSEFRCVQSYIKEDDRA